MKRPHVLTAAALDAMAVSISAHLAGEEGEGDCAGVKHADLRRALNWIHEEERRRGVRRKRAKR